MPSDKLLTVEEVGEIHARLLASKLSDCAACVDEPCGHFSNDAGILADEMLALLRLARVGAMVATNEISVEWNRNRIVAEIWKDGRSLVAIGDTLFAAVEALMEKEKGSG